MGEEDDRMPTKIDLNKCVGCGECIDVCPASPCVYEMETTNNKKRPTILHPKSCINCGACVIACPENAINKED
jgi:NAD-dependent dihydropyrimidine dehydrogenase PreA subunit